MSDQDWAPVVLRKKKAPPSEARTKGAINAALRSGAGVTTEKKYNAGANKKHATDLNVAVLDAESDKLQHERVSLELGKVIMQARTAKGMTQKDLSTQINEKPAIVQSYESGKSIPNSQILSKMERILGVKLRGKDIGKPLGPKPKK